MRLSLSEIRANAMKFAAEWAEVASERAEAQTFWTELFAVFGIKRRSVASFEEKVRNLKGKYDRIDVFYAGVMIGEHIRKLVEVFNRLANAGNTLVVIEHNLDVIKCADWLIDLGPEGGDGGGRIVASGAPETVMAAAASYTGRYLKKHVEVEAARGRK